MTDTPAPGLTTKTLAPGHMLWLDALRGFAAVAVALFHGMIVLWVGLRGLKGGHGLLHFVDFGLGIASLPLHYGYAAVMLFFLLSGFVIHLPYADGRRHFSIQPYLIRRFLRIYPPYFAAILASLLVATWFKSGFSFHLPLTNFDTQHILKSILLIQNYPHAGGAMAELASNQPASNLSLWSLPVEMELYLAYPLLWLGRRYMSLKQLSLLVILVSVIATLCDHLFAASLGQRFTFGNFIPTFLHFWCIWAAGAWLAEAFVTGALPRWKTSHLWILAGATIIALLCREQLRVWHDVEDYVWTIVFFLVFLWLAQSKVNVTNPVVRALGTIGTFSYSLYLIHIPIFVVIAAQWARLQSGLPSSYAICIAAVVLVVIPLSAGMYILIERPSIAAGKSLSNLADRFAAKKRTSRTAPVD